MYRTENFTNFTPAHFESQGIIHIGGREIPYHTVSEDNVFYNMDGKPIASIFSYSYFRSDVEDVNTRPVLFCFNGGPGASSMYVHAGIFGVKRMVYEEVDRPTSLPPFKVQENPDSLLDIADVVIVDPVNTGYGLLIDESCGDQFFGIEEDADALLTFIGKWLTRYKRWGSPKYLVGESYGCTRAAVAAGLGRTRGKYNAYEIAFDGIVFIGNTVTVGKYFNVNVPTERAVLYFPSYAGVNWYHNHPSDQDVHEFVMEAKQFADTEYLLALYKGDSISDDEREHIIERVCYYTGVSRQYLEERNLNIEDSSFRSEVIKNSGRAVSRYDGRVTRPLYSPRAVEDEIGRRNDATADRYDPAFYSVTTGEIMDSLNVTLDRNYIGFINVLDCWNKDAPKGNTAEQLREAMLSSQGMRVFFASGLYDLCTHMGIVYYTVNHAGLPHDRISIKNYPAGHMVYLGEETCRELSQDIRKFISGKDPNNA
ncbi:MAG: S10 family peptidase [Oscillospiraceae bacterium]